MRVMGLANVQPFKVGGLSVEHVCKAPGRLRCARLDDGWQRRSRREGHAGGHLGLPDRNDDLRLFSRDLGLRGSGGLK